RVLIAFSKFCLLASFGESHPASKNELKATKITTTFFDLIIIFPLYQTIKFLASAAGCSVPSICRRKLVCDGITIILFNLPRLQFVNEEIFHEMALIKQLL
ncbi:hypothetical protein AAB246_005237, partial [Escherichia coli]